MMEANTSLELNEYHKIFILGSSSPDFKFVLGLIINNEDIFEGIYKIHSSQFKGWNKNNFLQACISLHDRIK